MNNAGYKNGTLIRLFGGAVLSLLVGCSVGGGKPNADSGTTSGNGKPPEITTFTTNFPVFAIGEKPVFAATFANGIGSIDNGIGSISNGGTAQGPALTVGDKTFTLTVSSTGQPSATKSVTVTVVDTTITAPARASEGVTVQATVPTITGASYAWTATGATISGSASGNQVFFVPSVGAAQVLLSVDISVPGRTMTSTATVGVDSAPGIGSFVATPSSIFVGGSAQLTATFNGGPGSIDNGVGIVSSGAPVNVSPGSTTTYTLSVPTATVPATATATVTVYPAPILSLGGASIPNGGSKILTLGNALVITPTFSGGTAVLMPGNIPLTSGQAVSLSPAATTTYTLTATTATGGVGTASFTVVVVPAPRVVSFSVN